MASPDSQDKHRSSQIDDLIAKQDHVIKELDDLDKRLLATIEELKAAKKKAAEAAGPVENSQEKPARKAA